MNNPETILQDQLRRQSEPFDALWASRTKMSDGAYLAPLRTHALRVLRLISSLSNMGHLNPPWDGAHHNLNQALSLRSVGLYTDLYGDSQWCRPSYEFEKASSKVKERFVAGQLVFQGAWNALEIAGEILFSHGKKPTSQAVRHKFEKFGHQPIFGLKEAMFEAHSRASTYINTHERPFKEAIAAGSYLGISAELLRQFRNGTFHGKIQSLEPRDWGKDSDDKTCQTQSELFHAQIRLVLFLLQAIIARIEQRHAVWFQEGDLVDELMFAVQIEIPEDAVDHTEEETDAPCLFMDQKFIHDI